MVLIGASSTGLRLQRFAAVFIGMLLLGAAASAADAPPAMIVPGQFNVSSTGAATYTIPIAVPPGTAGMVPALSLDYSSQASDGIVGIGWTLSGLPSIARCPKTVAQDSVHGAVNYDANDRFCLDGQRLMVIGGGTYGGDGSHYRTEIDNFSDVQSVGGSTTDGPDHFIVRTKSGQIIEFGNSVDARILAAGSSTKIRAWAVSKISDTAGNYLTVTYNCAPVVSSACTDTDRTTNGEARPLRIDYTGHASSPTLSPFNSVQFAYGTRTDAVPMYQAGFLQKTTHVLTDIQTYQASNLVYEYKLTYRAGTSTLRSRLTEVQLCYDAAATHCLAPTQFDWQGGTGLPTLSGNGQSLAQGLTFVPGDWNGDGNTDVMVAGSPPGCGIYLSSPTGVLSSSSITVDYTRWTHDPDHVPPYYSEYVYNEPPCFPMTQGRGSRVPSDFNGDGFSDIAVTQNHALNAPYQHVLLNDKGSPETIIEAGTTPGTQAIAVTDFNGDGRADIFDRLSPSDDYLVNLSNGDGTFTDGASFTFASGSYAAADFDGDGCADFLKLSTSNSIVFSCSQPAGTVGVSSWAGARLVLGDFNGDGKTDILVTYAAAAGTLYLSTGTGTTGTPLVATSFSVPTDWGKYTIVVGDWNGDGKADLGLMAAGGSGMYTHGTDHQIWLSTGDGFVSATTIPNNNSADTSETPTVADWNNDGAGDIWLQKPSGDTVYTFAYTPELISTFKNGIGAQTTVTYDRMNQNGSFYAKGSSASYPAQDADGPLYAVKQVDATNGVGGTYTSTYAYAGIKVDLSGRGFLGFTSVTITDIQSSVVQTTNYSTTFPVVGLVTSQIKTHGSVTLSDVENSYESVALGSGRYFVGLQQTATTSNDLDGTALPPSMTTYHYDCDDSTTCYGNATEVKACIPDCTSPTSSTTTDSTFTNDTTNWFLGRVTSTTVVSAASGVSNITRKSSFSYASSTGILTQEIIEPDSSRCQFTLQTDYTLDAFGHRTTTTVSGPGCSTGDIYSIATRSSQAGYDAAGTFQTSATNALSQSETWTYNMAFAEPASHTGPNGLTTSWTYDNYGRPTLEVRPDATRTVVSYDYCSGVNGGSASCPTNASYVKQTEAFDSSGSTQIGPIAKTYYDSLSRVIAQDVQGFSGCNIRSSTIYDDNGRVHETSRPYFVATSGICSDATPQWTVNTYDALGRVTHSAFPSGGYVDFTYHGLTTSAENDHSQTTTTVLDSRGLKASVQDAAGSTTTYTYDAVRNLLTVTDPSSNVITNVYDARGGSKTDSYDPDMGHWTYVSDVLGELKQQTDAKSQTTTLKYDVLGRVTERLEGSVYSNWFYGTTAPAIGKLVKSCTSASSNSDCSGTSTTLKSFTYDSLGRPSGTTITVAGANYAYTTAYNATNGAVDQVNYPSGLAVRNIYNALGYLCRLADTSGSASCSSGTAQMFWTANGRDAELHLTSQTAGNSITTSQSFDSQTGLLTAVNAGSSNSVAAFGYSYDTLGDLTGRTDTNENLTEKYCYTDPLNRLTNSATGASGVSLCTSSGTGITTKTVGYDALGNILAKSDICGSSSNCYVYSTTPGTGSRPHAVDHLSAGAVNGFATPYYQYDLNGNMTCMSSAANCTGTVAETVGYTAFNMTSSIAQGTTALCIAYDADHSRITMESRSTSCSGTLSSTTTYLNDPASGAMSEKVVGSSGSIVWHDYLQADGHIIAQRTVQASTAPTWGSFNWASTTPPGQHWTAPAASWAYFVLDHLGSISVVMDESGNVTERLSYDAWGKRRNADGTDLTACNVTTPTTRGFTGHEMLDPVCLISANARMYDPALGRFLSPDPGIEQPFNLQVLNRFTYVGDNPLSFTDPSGLCFLGCFWKNPIFVAIVSIAIAIFVPEAIYGSFGVFTAGTAASIADVAIGGALSGAVSAGLTGGNILKGALFGGLSAAAFAGLVPAAGAGLGNTLNGLGIGLHTASIIGDSIAAGLIGGISSAAQGGNFVSGFLAAGVGSLAGPIIGGAPNAGITPEGVFVSAVLGGTASILGGGKFANGAITGAFAYVASSIARGAREPEEADGLASDGLDCKGAYACTRPNSNYSAAEVHYNESYYKLDPISQAAVDLHEWGIHVPQVNHWLNSLTVWDRLWGAINPDYLDNQFHTWVGVNRVQLELPAYDAQLTYLEKHVNDYGGRYYVPAIKQYFGQLRNWQNLKEVH